MRDPDRSAEPVTIAPIIAKNLKWLMSRRKITAKVLAQETGVSYSTITKLLCALIPNPGIVTLKPIADYFAIYTDLLITPSLNLYGTLGQSINTSKVSIPMVDWNLITKIKNINDIDLKNWQQWESVDYKLASVNMFALPCKKSMEARFPQGTIFFVNTLELPKDGDLVVVQFNFEEGASLRELLIDPPSWQLKAISPDTPSVLYNKDEHKILGVIMLTCLVGKRQS